MPAFVYVLDAYEGGLPSAMTLGLIADAAEAGGAPSDYVADASLAPLPLARLTCRSGPSRGRTGPHGRPGAGRRRHAAGEQRHPDAAHPQQDRERADLGAAPP